MSCRSCGLENGVLRRERRERDKTEKVINRLANCRVTELRLLAYIQQ